VLIDRELYELLEPGVKALGFEMLTVEKTDQGSSSVLRVYIDNPEGITVDDCARVSDQVSAILDIEDPIADRYSLEVSSPGFDRPLCRLAHFEAVVGQKIRIQTTLQISARKRFTGILSGVTAEALTLDIDGEVHVVPMDDILKARLAPAR
jgi:ribosome maturation factor RimP